MFYNNTFSRMTDMTDFLEISTIEYFCGLHCDCRPQHRFGRHRRTDESPRDPIVDGGSPDLCSVARLGDLPHASDSPGVRALQDRDRFDGLRGCRAGFGIPAMRFEGTQDLIGQPDGAQGVVAADPGPR